MLTLENIIQNKDMKGAKERIQKANTLLICTNYNDIEEDQVKERLSNFSKVHKRFDPTKMITIDLLDQATTKKRVDINGLYPEALYDIYKQIGFKKKKQFMYILLWFCPVFDFDLKKLSSFIDKDLLKTGVVSIITGDDNRDNFKKALSGKLFVIKESTKHMNDIVFTRVKKTNVGSQRNPRMVRSQRNPRMVRSQRNPQDIKSHKSKRCKDGKILNHATNRCISKTGTTAKKIQVTKQTTTIGGPITISYYEIEFGGITKKLLLFGDLHIQYGLGDDPSTITITTLMKKLIRQCPHCVDLFVERGVEQIYQIQIEDSDEFEDQEENEEVLWRAAASRAWAEYTKLEKEEKKKKTKQTGGRRLPLNEYSCPLHAVREEFSSCPVTISLYKCPFDNLRYHNWDLRILSDDHPRLLTGTGWANWYFTVLGQYWSHPSIWKHITDEDMMKYLLGFDIGQTRGAIDEIFDAIFDLNVPRWEEQGIIKNMRKQKKYQTHMEKVIQRAYKKMLASLPDFPKDFLDTFIQVYSPSVNKGGSNLNGPVGFSLIFTDFYLLCRMFKKFSTSEGKNIRTPKRCPTTEKQRKKTSQPMTYETPQYIMIYAGARHSAYVGKFLEEMFSVKPLYSHRDCKKFLLKKNTVSNSLLEMEKMQQMTLSDIKFSAKFKQPDNIMGLFAPFLT
jgi:hypothetical protein